VTLRDGPPAWARFISRLYRILACWWVWTARPFMLHPIQTIRDWLRPDEPLTAEDLEGLTEGEVRALRGWPDVEPASIYKDKK